MKPKRRHTIVTHLTRVGLIEHPARLDKRYTDRMNNELAQLGVSTWVEVPPCERTTQAPNQWLSVAFKEKVPLLEGLVTSLGGISARENVPKVTLDPAEILGTIECSWQDRTLAAA